MNTAPPGFSNAGFGTGLPATGGSGQQMVPTQGFNGATIMVPATPEATVTNAQGQSYRASSGPAADIYDLATAPPSLGNDGSTYSPYFTPELGGAAGTANSLANAYTGEGANFLTRSAQNPWANGQAAASAAASQGDAAQQQQALGLLAAQANGTGPNYAAQAANGGLAQSIAQQRSLAASAGPGSGGALAARNAANQTANLQQSTANSIAQTTASNQLAAQQAYAQAASAAAQQGQQELGMQQQGAAQYGSLVAQQQAQNDAAALQSQEEAEQLQQGQLSATTANSVSILNSANQQQMAQNQANANLQNQVIGGTIAAGGAILGAVSDVNAKSAITPAGGTMMSPAMRQLAPQSFASAMRPGMPASPPPTNAPMPPAAAPSFAQAMGRTPAPMMGVGGGPRVQVPPAMAGGYPGGANAMMPQSRGAIGGHPGGANMMVPSAGAVRAPFVPQPAGARAFTPPNPAMQRLQPSQPSVPSVPVGGAAGAGALTSGITAKTDIAPAGGVQRPVWNAQMISDDRAKAEKSVERAAPDGETEADRFLSTMAPYSYRYKDPSNEPTSSPTGGRYLGVMAQNLERSPTGDTIVKDTPRGKVLEGGALMSAMAAGEGRLHERLRAVESHLASMKGAR